MELRQLLAAGIVTAALPGAAVLAQETVPPVTVAAAVSAATEELVELEAITVSARRREEELQDVPLAISVIDASVLDSTGSFNVQRLQQLAPTLQFYSQNPRNSAANIRGLGAPFGLTNDGIEQGVGLYVDDVYYSRAASSTLDFLDVERIEVLRGPQGTLYGKNTTAGAINITTRAPTFFPEAKTELSIGSLGFYQAKAALSGPLLGDTVAARLAFSATNRHGSVYNTASTNRINEQDNIGVRGQILWRAGDNLDVTLAGDYNKQNPEGHAYVVARAVETQRQLNRRYPYLLTFYNANTGYSAYLDPDNANATVHYAPASIDGFDRLTDVDAGLSARSELGGAALRAVWDLGAGTFTSVTAWRYWDWLPANDRDFTGLPVTTNSENPSKQDQYTQEFRYAATHERFDYVVGLFGYKQSVHTDGFTRQGGAASRWSLGGGFNGVPAILDGLSSYNDIDFSNTSAALFGQLSFKVTDRLRIEPGLRLNYDKKNGSYDADVQNGDGDWLPDDQTDPFYTDPTPYDPPGAATSITISEWDRNTQTTVSRTATVGDVRLQQRSTLPPQYYAPTFKDWNVSGDLKASFEITEDVLTYANYGRSFKTGGITLNGAPPRSGDGQANLDAVTVRPEEVNAYELGLKTQFLDRRATFNVAGFRTDVKDFQLTVTSSGSGADQIINARGFLANAEKVRVQGVEFDFSIRPTTYFTAYVNGAFTDAKYVDFEGAPAPPELAGATSTNPADYPGTDPAGPGVPTGAGAGYGPATYDASGTWLPGVSRLAGSWGFEFKKGATLLGRQGEAYFGYDGSARSRWSSNPTRSAAREFNWALYDWGTTAIPPNSEASNLYSGRASGLDVAGYGLANFRVGFRSGGSWDVYGWVKNAFDKDYWDHLVNTPSSTGLVAGLPGDARTWGVTVRAEF